MFLFFLQNCLNAGACLSALAAGSREVLTRKKGVRNSGRYKSRSKGSKNLETQATGAGAARKQPGLEQEKSCEER